MSDHVKVSSEELTTEELMDLLENDRRVIVDVSVLGQSMERVVRKSGDTYYCDTPMRLYIHETPEGMRRCLEQNNLVKRPDNAPA